MKITKQQLRKIIKEELLKEAGGLPGRQFGGTMADLDADAKTRETDFLSTSDDQGVQGMSGESLKRAVMMAQDIVNIVDPKTESGQLIKGLHSFLTHEQGN
jgi:hypothetical protein|tara:strand:+ start:5907 stop:6209 length:303 start_codon:yes stop_codon:yes gene_type:complete